MNNPIMNGKWSCQLCGYREDERAIQEQCGFNLCRSCYGEYSDEELKDKLSSMTKIKEVSLSLTFEQDTIIGFNRNEFNLKGYRYYIDIEDRLCVLEQDEMPRLKAELGEGWRDVIVEKDWFGQEVIAFSEDDFINMETFDPITTYFEEGES
tara:strand:+ start:203 stop:658 length:456 start_codon:yes stop_codon:yes gene_type:complete